MSIELNPALQKYCLKWNLSEPVLLATTATSGVYLVKMVNRKAILKILNSKGQESEADAAIVLRCFNGVGAVHILNFDGEAHLLEYAEGPALRSLVEKNQDRQATEIICDVVKNLHSYNKEVPAQAISMRRNFQSLFAMAAKYPDDGFYSLGAKVAEELIGTAKDIKVLHGDIHHENILNSERGWLAIDPKCLVGESTYDLANTFYNPMGFTDFAASPDTIQQRCEIMSTRLQMDKTRILQYAFALGCVSAVWCLEDQQNHHDTVKIAKSIQKILKI